MKGETFYKVLREDGSAIYGQGSWPLPKDGKPGAWLVVEGDLVPCRNGLHLCRPDDLLHWLGPMIYTAEVGRERVEAEDKIVVRCARLLKRCENWNETTARLFAADCAERVLPLFEKARPGDDRPRKAIEAARAFARGEISRDELRTAANAAYAAAYAAANAANAYAANAAYAAANAAANAAYAAYAANAATRKAEREWQTRRLFQYLNGEETH